MPQSSLSSWLKRPSGLQQPPAAGPLSSRTPFDDTSGNMASDDSSMSVGGVDKTSQNLQLKSSEANTSNTARQLPTNIEIRACRKEDIPHLKRLNSLLLPIPYPESFYREIIEDPLTSSITLVAVWHDNTQAVAKEKGRLVGAIRCRIFAHPPVVSALPSAKPQGAMLYLSTVVLLSPYRSYGIASRMLEILTKRAIKEHEVTSIGAHVWEANADGMEWYRKRGFREVDKEENYYRRLKPQGAFIVQKDLGIVDMINT